MITILTKFVVPAHNKLNVAVLQIFALLTVQEINLYFCSGLKQIGLILGHHSWKSSPQKQIPEVSELPKNRLCTLLYYHLLHFLIIYQRSMLRNKFKYFDYSIICLFVPDSPATAVVSINSSSTSSKPLLSMSVVQMNYKLMT